MKKLLIILAAVTALSGTAFAQRNSGTNGNGSGSGSGTTVTGALVGINRSPVVQGNFNAQANAGLIGNIQSNTTQQNNGGAVGISGPSTSTITR